MTTVSHSKLNTYRTCKLKYKYQYIEKKPTDVENTIEAFMGDMVHQTLEKIYKDKQFMKENTVEQLLQFYHELWNKNYSDNILIVKKQYTDQNYKEKGEKMIRDFYNTNHPFDQEKTIGLETQFYYQLDENNKIHVRIDRLAIAPDGTYEIHDYKTNSNLATQEEKDQDEQLAIYAMGVKEKYPDATKIKLIWHFLAFDKKIISYRTDKQLADLRNKLLEDIETINNTIRFEPEKSPLCSYCAYQKDCPLWAHMFKTEKGNTDTGQSLLQKYIKLNAYEEKLKQKKEQIEKKILEFSKNNNLKALHDSEYSLTIWTKNSVKLPDRKYPNKKKFEEVLKQLSLHDMYTEVNTWQLEKDWDKLPNVKKEVLKNFAENKKIIRLYLNKKD